MRVVMGKLPTPQIIIFDWRLCSVAMSGKTTAPFRCPCTDAHAPRGHSFWVVLEGPGGWPSVLSGRCFRCRDHWVATHFHNPTDPDTAELGTYAVRRRTPFLWRSNEVVGIVHLHFRKSYQHHKLYFLIIIF